MPILAVIVLVCAFIVIAVLAIPAIMVIGYALIWCIGIGAIGLALAAILVWLDPRERRNREYRRKRDEKLLNDARSNLLRCLESKAEASKERDPQPSA